LPVVGFFIFFFCGGGGGESYLLSRDWHSDTQPLRGYGVTENSVGFFFLEY